MVQTYSYVPATIQMESFDAIEKIKMNHAPRSDNINCELVMKCKQGIMKAYS